MLETGGGSDGEPATVKAASTIASPILGRELTQREKEIGGPLLPDGFGTLNDGLYGALAESLPGIAAAGGLVFATALWLVADEAVAPATG
jgi:hypothetical protein